MKLVTFLDGQGAERVGVLHADETKVFDLLAANPQPYFETMLALMEAGEAALTGARDVLAGTPDRISNATI